jgi:hypothetical protein
MAAIDVRRALLTALSIGGYLAAFCMYLAFAGGDLQTIGADLVAYLRAASDLVAGRPVTSARSVVDQLPYAPTWAVSSPRCPGCLRPCSRLASWASTSRRCFITGSWRVTGYLL